MNNNKSLTMPSNESLEEEIHRLKQTIPKAFYRGTEVLIKYQEFWIAQDTNQLCSILKLQRNFVAQDTDILITSIPKTGSTWLQSLLFATINRDKHPCVDTTNHPLARHHPHEVVRKLDSIYNDDFSDSVDVDEMSSPRLFFTHLPYESLPESIKSSKCRILQITRNPLDTVVSLWYFVGRMLKVIYGEDCKPPCFEEFFEDFYDGRFVYGPFFEHVIGYWKQSLQSPNKVMFLTYEDLKDDTKTQLKNVAKFVGVPFSNEEEIEGVVDWIIELCSFKSLRDMEVNKSGVIKKVFEKNSYFRKGEVGDWANHLNANMVVKMKELMELKLKGTGLSFRLTLEE
ncbi:hypothetical protein vseg_018813 [Gypsophila vaccaria]